MEAWHERIHAAAFAKPAMSGIYLQMGCANHAFAIRDMTPSEKAPSEKGTQPKDVGEYPAASTPPVDLRTGSTSH